MITLKEALILTGIEEDEICFLKYEGTDRHDHKILTKKDIVRKYDLKAAQVTGIHPYFQCNEFAGMEFIIKKNKGEKI